MKVTIHQPEHMPWLGFFHKINMADTYVVLDNVQYRRRYFQNRNKIRTKDGWQWLGVPLKKENRDTLLIKDARIFSEDSKWQDTNLQTLYHNYHNAGHFRNYWDRFKVVYNRQYSHLLDLNIALIIFFLEALSVKKNVILASDLNCSGKKGNLMLDICKRVGAKTYVSGISGREYLNIEDFKKSSIEVIFQEFHHPVYNQCHKPFIPCMSIIDLLFNHGDKSLDIINGKDTPVMEEVFL